MSVQRYISNELTHFVGRKEANQDQQYYLFSKILKEGFLSHSPHMKGVSGGIIAPPNGKLSDNNLFISQSICFCDIPHNDIEIHINKYSQFGISFTKDFIVENGGSPVFYIPIDCKLKLSDAKSNIETVKISDYFNEIIEKYKLNEFGSKNLILKSVDNVDIFRFFASRIFGYIIFFDHNLPDDHPKNYYFEREWRIVGNLEFELTDVKTIFIPKKYYETFQADFPDYYGQLNFLDP